MEYLSVKNFDQFQHYKDRNPPWIKFYVSVLDNYEYGCLQDASKAHLMGIWLLASKMDNRVPADPEWIGKRIQASSVVDLQVLAEQGFIELSSNTLASCKRSAMPETETETETDSMCNKQINAVVRAYLALHPKRRVVDSAGKRKIKARLRDGFTVDDLCKALSGQAADQWCIEKNKLGLEYALRDADHVQDFMAKNGGKPSKQQEIPLANPKR